MSNDIYAQIRRIATGNDAGNMPPDVRAILDGYRTPVMG